MKRSCAARQSGSDASPASPSRRLSERWAILSAISFAFACAIKPPALGEPGSRVEDRKAESAYREVLGRFTKHGEIYSELELGEDTRVFCETTYQSWAYRQARVKRMGIFQVQPPDVVAQNLAIEQAENSQYYEFFFGVHVNNYRFDDFDRPNSIWRIALVTEAGELTPISVERLGRADLAMRGIYPYMSEFWVAYRIRFAKGTAAGASLTPEKVLFRIASTLGKVELSFLTE